MLPNVAGFTVIADIGSSDTYKRVQIADGKSTADIANYIKDTYCLINDRERQDIMISLTTAETDTGDAAAGKMIHYNGHFYEYRTISEHPWPSWNQAKADAEKQTFLGRMGYLATINDAQEFQNILALFQEQSPAVWLGGKYLNAGESCGLGIQAEKDGWYWATDPDTTVRSTPFLIGGPKNSGGEYIYQSGYGTIPEGGLDFWNRADINGDGQILDTERSEPNNSAVDGALNERYLQMTNTGMWNDLRGYECKVDASKENGALDHAMETTYYKTTEAIGAGIPNGYIVEYGDAVISSGEEKTAEVTIPMASYEVSFNANGEFGTIDSQTIVKDGKATKPVEGVEPIKTDYTFSGWYTEEACTNLWDFNTNTVTKDMILYAGWTLNPEVTYAIDGNQTQDKKIIKQGNTLTIQSVGGAGEYIYIRLLMGIKRKQPMIVQMKDIMLLNCKLQGIQWFWVIPANRIIHLLVGYLQTRL